MIASKQLEIEKKMFSLRLKCSAWKVIEQSSFEKPLARRPEKYRRTFLSTIDHSTCKATFNDFAILPTSFKKEAASIFSVFSLVVC